MTTRLLRRIAIVLIAFYAFGQASIAMAGCGMDRGEMAQAMSMAGGEPCGDCAVPGPQDVVTAACVAHCTADLQLTNSAPEAIPARAIELVAILPVPSFRSPPAIASPPPGTLPRRILLHSFQV